MKLTELDTALSLKLGDPRTDNGDGTYTTTNTGTTSLTSKHSVFDDLDEVINSLKQEDNKWIHFGDSIDVAFLSLGKKFNVSKEDINLESM